MDQESFNDAWGQLHVVTRSFDAPWPPTYRYERLDAEQAARVLCEALCDSFYGGFLQRFLQLDELPLHVHPGDLSYQVARLVAEPWAELAVYRRLEAHSEPALDRASRSGSKVDETPVVQAMPTSWVGVEVVTTSGAPLPDVRVVLGTPDGAVRTLSTSFAGSVRVDGIPAGPCTIALPTVAPRRWDIETVGARQPGITHVVQPGECLAHICDRHGYADWKQVWSDAKNAPLRARRTSPHVLLAGDTVVLPEREVGQITRGTDAMHRIVVRDREPMLVTVRLRFESRWRSPLSDLTYTISFLEHGELVSRPGAGPTQADGSIEEQVPAHVRSVLITFARPKLCFKLALGALDPVQDGQEPVASGVHARLRALGHGGEASAVAQFQRDELGHAEPSNVCDAATAQELAQRYGA